MSYPEWVTKQKRPGTNITCSKGHYYLYEVSSVWDKEKKRARKITGKYLGRITQEGLLPPKRQLKPEGKISVKEYGASSVLCEVGNDIYDNLKKIYPEKADMIFSLGVLRTIEKCPFKRAAFLYEHSYLSERFGKLPMSGASISGFLKELGTDREKIVSFMKTFLADTRHVLFDGTNIISKSEKTDNNRLGYNSHRQYDPQINLLYAFSSEKNTPAYYRVVPGNIRDVTAFSQTVSESGITDMTVIADKGFGSKDNLKMLEDNNLRYIVPLKRNNSMIKRDIIESGKKEDFDGVFMFNERVIWYYSYKTNNKKIHVFLDRSLQNKEEKDYLRRINNKNEGYTTEEFINKQYTFGTIALCTNIDESSENIYCLYKSRSQIEQNFDFLKNLLELDKVYLQNDYSVEGWAFVNHISLMLCYRLYDKLKQANLLSSFSIEDLLVHLKYIHKSFFNNSWVSSEISSKTLDILNALNLHIT